MDLQLLKNNFRDMKRFLSELESEDIDLKSIGVRGADKKTIISIMY